MILAASSNSELHTYGGLDRGQLIVPALFLREKSMRKGISIERSMVR